jgi:8-oxo-dGTP pyrophosphatase MutT (NUDIX family)
VTFLHILANIGQHDPIYAYKICAARELYEETGIDLRRSLDRLQPVQLKSPKEDELACQYKKRIFLSAEIFDDDLSLQHNRDVLTSSLTQALDKTPPHAMVR